MSDGTSDNNGIGALFAMSEQEDKFFLSRGEEEVPGEAGEEVEAPADEAPEPEAEAADPEPEAVEEPAPERVKMVPHQALHAEREERKKLAAQLEEVNRKLAEITKPKAEPTEEVPSFEDDPAGYLRWQNKQALDKVAALEAERAQELAQRQAVERWNQEVAYYNQKLSEESKSIPDFMDAYNFAKSGRVSELVAIGLTEEQARQTVDREEYSMAVASHNEGRPFSERILNWAKARGYRPQPKQPAPAPVKKTLDRPSLSKSGAGSSKGELTAEDLANMSDAEFAKATSGAKWRQFWQG